MDKVSVEYCVEDALRRGLRDEAVVQSVMARISRPGVEVDWGHAPITNPFWMEHMTRDERGRKLSGRQIKAASNRYIINRWEEHLLEKLEAEALDPQVFEQQEEGNYAPCGTLTALDEGSGWDVTLAQRIRRQPIDKLLQDLEPILRSLATKARRTFTLEEDCAEDLKQVARIKIASGLASYEGRCDFATWAYRVAWRAMVDFGRSEATRRSREMVGFDGFEEEANDEFPEVDDRLTLRPILHQAMSLVSGADLVLLQLLGYRDSEVSDENIRMKRQRARKRLGQLLGDDPEILVSLSV